MLAIFLRACIIWIFFMIPPVQAEVSLSQAEQYYQQNKFEQVISLYEQLYEQHPHSPTLMYNLGNAYAKSGYTGKSIAMYKRALNLKPRDKKTRYNLEVVLQKTIDYKEDGFESMYSRFFSWIGVSLSAFLAVGFWTFLIAFGWLFYQYPKSFYYRNLFILNGIVTVAFLGVFVGAYLKTVTINKGVVIEKKASVYSGPSVNLERRFFVHEGLVFKIMRESGDWVEIQLNNELTGWLEKRFFWEI